MAATRIQGPLVGPVFFPGMVWDPVLGRYVPPASTPVSVPAPVSVPVSVPAPVSVPPPATNAPQSGGGLQAAFRHPLAKAMGLLDAYQMAYGPTWQDRAMGAGGLALNLLPQTKAVRALGMLNNAANVYQVADAAGLLPALEATPQMVPEPEPAPAPSKIRRSGPPPKMKPAASSDKIRRSGPY